MSRLFLELLADAKEPTLVFSPVSYGILLKMTTHQPFTESEKDLHGDAADLYLVTSVWRTTGVADGLFTPA